MIKRTYKIPTSNPGVLESLLAIIVMFMSVAFPILIVLACLFFAARVVSLILLLVVAGLVGKMLGSLRL